MKAVETRFEQMEQGNPIWLHGVFNDGSGMIWIKTCCIYMRGSQYVFLRSEELRHKRKSYSYTENITNDRQLAMEGYTRMIDKFR